MLSRLASALSVSSAGAGLVSKIAIALSYGLSRLGAPVRARIRVLDRIFPITIYSGADRTVLNEMIVRREYDSVVAPSPPVIVDIGANVGFSALYLAARFPDATIHAIEPSPETFRRLTRNTEGVPNIRRHNLAIGAATGELPFYVAPDHFGASFQPRGRPGERMITVPVSTLTAFLDREKIERVGLLKFDVEGAEVAVVAGLDPSRVSQVVGELHFDLMDKPLDWFSQRLGRPLRVVPTSEKRAVVFG